MRESGQITLLHYLKHDSYPFHLELESEGGQSTCDGPSLFPSLADSDPLSRVIKGRVLTDAGTLVRDVLLVVQRDEYGFTDDHLCPFTNVDVEQAWQQAFTSYLNNRHGGLILLSKQIGPVGTLARMDPLFFCSRTGAFFSPPCPSCGLPLKQCENDDVLKRAGLKPYTQSLRRYLYCETCAGQGQVRFYAYKTDGSEPTGVENSSGLIRRMGLLVNSSTETVDFPCRACQFRDECYGTEEKTVVPLSPFAFYPFYMLMVALPYLIMGNVQKEGEREKFFVAREHALRLGWSLITSVCKGQKEQFVPHGLAEKVEMLREGMKEDVLLVPENKADTDLVAEGHETTGGMPLGKVVSDDEVCGLLAEIRSDWRNRVRETASTPPPRSTSDDMEVESVETIFLNIADLDRVPSSGLAEDDQALGKTAQDRPLRAESPEDTDKTVILSGGLAKDEMDTEKTVVLNVGLTPEADQPAAADVIPAPDVGKGIQGKSDQKELEETIIIPAGYQNAQRDTGVDEPALVPTPTPGAAQDEGNTPKKPVDKDEDSMEATVILKLDERPKTKGNR